MLTPNFFLFSTTALKHVKIGKYYWFSIGTNSENCKYVKYAWGRPVRDITGLAYKRWDIFWNNL